MQKGMSALPPIADMCGAKRDVRFVPIADIGSLQLLRNKGAETASPLIGLRGYRVSRNAARSFIWGLVRPMLKRRL